MKALFLTIVGSLSLGACSAGSPLYQEGFVEDFKHPLKSINFSIPPPSSKYALNNKVYYAIGKKEKNSTEGFSFMWQSNCAGKTQTIWIYGFFLLNKEVTDLSTNQSVSLNKRTCAVDTNTTNLGKNFEALGGREDVYICPLADGTYIKAGHILSKTETIGNCLSESKTALAEALDGLVKYR